MAVEDPGDPPMGHDPEPDPDAPGPRLPPGEVDRLLDAAMAQLADLPGTIDVPLEDRVRQVRARLDRLTQRPPDPVQAKLAELEKTVQLLSRAVTDLTGIVGRLADERLGPPAAGDA